LFIQTTPSLSNLDFAANFEHFPKPKTIDNIVEWLNETIKALHLKQSDLNQVTADGASNAIGSVAEFESRTRSERDNDIGVDTCIAHQNERAGGYASGTLDFAEPVNLELGAVLKKSHGLQVRLGRSGARMEVLRGVMRKNNRNPLLAPNPGNETRWNSGIDETERANVIMGDACDAFKELLSEGGEDCGLLDKKEKELGDIEWHTYTFEDKLILRQYEGSAKEAKQVSLFTQMRGNSYAYLLLTIKIALQRSSCDRFEIPEGIYFIFHSVLVRH
jgi:hypothetical protein